MTGAVREGAPITFTFYLDDGPFTIENYFLSVQTHEDAFRAAGFKDVRWRRPMLSPEGEAAYGREFWADFLDDPPVTFIECSI